MSLEAMLRQYEKNDVTTQTSTKFDKKNYFTTHLEKNQTAREARIRILPGSENESPFVEAMGHTAQVEGQWPKFMCPKHTKGEPCPFCEAREILLGTGLESDKELAKKFNAKKFYIVKVIDRDNEADGVKFWRFAHSYAKTGVLDKIFGFMKKTGDFTDPDTGRDLTINIARDQKGNPIVQSILPDFETSPLSTNADVAKEWLEDKRTWQDVYAVKSYEYLEIIVKGGVPHFDKEAKKWVDKLSIDTPVDTSDDEITLGGGSNQAPVIVAAPAVQTNTLPSSLADAASNDAGEEEDDLPF